MTYESPRQRKRASRTAESKIALVHFRGPEQEPSDPYCVALRLGIERRCAERQMEYVKAYQTDSLPDAKVLRDTVGVIVIGWHFPEEEAWLTAHARNIVFADFTPLDCGIGPVVNDLNAATNALLESLAGPGCRHIGFAGRTDRLARGGIEKPEKRFVAYEACMRDHGWYEPALCLLGHNTEDSGCDIALRMLGAAIRPDVLVTANDTMAKGAYREIRKPGLKIPADTAVVGFIDAFVARFKNPPLTTVRLGADETGETAMALLPGRLSGRGPAKRVVLASRID